MDERITWPARTAAWVSQNGTELLLGLAVALALVALMLLLCAVGHRIVAKEPDCRTWKSVIGRVLSRTGLLFMMAAALEIVASYTEPPERIGRLVHIIFIVVATFQGAIWARELVMGIIGRQVGDEPGESTLGNARSVIRVLVSVA